METFSIVAQLDVPRHVFLGVSTGWILRAVDQLVLQGGEERLRHGIVVTLTGAPNRYRGTDQRSLVVVIHGPTDDGSLTPIVRATSAIGRDVSITIFAASSLYSGVKLWGVWLPPDSDPIRENISR